MSTPIDGNEFLVWRDAQEVEQASRAMLTPYSRAIENAPVYKTAYDVLTQVTLISKNISKNCQVPYGVRLKDMKEISLNSYSMIFEFRQR